MIASLRVADWRWLSRWLGPWIVFDMLFSGASRVHDMFGALPAYGDAPLVMGEVE